jgi:hypothetical protein
MLTIKDEVPQQKEVDKKASSYCPLDCFKSKVKVTEEPDKKTMEEPPNKDNIIRRRIKEGIKNAFRSKK